MPITTPPTAPSRTDPTTFPNRADAWVAWQETSLVPQINALEANVNAREASTVAASNAAAAVVNATLWVSGTSYTLGQAVFDPVNFLTYRRSVAGAGTTRPGLDAVNWVQVAGTGNVTLNGGQLAGFRNLLINGNFQINQRGYVSGTNVGAANTYTLDRWRVVTSGQNVTFTASGNGNQITAPAGGIEQVIEGINIGGGTYVLNWTGTATATVNGTARAKGASFTLSANTSATVRLIGGTASQVQLEPGSVATPFEHRPIGAELALCQRYFQAGQGVYLAGQAASGMTVGARQTIAPMRVTPTVVVVVDESAGAIGARAAFAASPSQIQVTAQGTTAGGFILDVAVTLSAEL